MCPQLGCNGKIRQCLQLSTEMMNVFLSEIQSQVVTWDACIDALVVVNRSLQLNSVPQGPHSAWIQPRTLTWFIDF